MKRLHAKSSLIGLLISTMLFGGAFLVPNVSLANGTCLTGDGTGTLAWNSTSCNLSLNGGTYALYVYDFTKDGGAAQCIQVVSSAQFTGRANTMAHILSFCSGAASTDRFMYVAQNSGTACGALSYTACSALGTNQTEAYPNITYNGSVFNLNAGGGGGGGGGGGTTPFHFGSGGIPPAYTANFTTTTQQAAAIGAIGDLNAFLWGFLPKLIVIMVCIIVLGLAITLIYTVARGEGYDERVDMERDFILAEEKRKGPDAL